MQSFVLPKDLNLSVCELPNQKKSFFFKREGPQGIFFKKRGGFSLSQLITIEGSRIYVSGVSAQQESQILSQLWKQAIGLSLGYRKRLRLIGIGFRAAKQSRSIKRLNGNFINEISNGSSTTTKREESGKSIKIPQYLIRQETNLLSKNNSQQKQKERKLLVLKLGFSHESGFPLISTEYNNIKIEASRLDGRTKGTLITIQGGNLAQVASTASVIQNFRFPDIYKGKGIHTDNRKLVLKKGKRQG